MTERVEIYFGGDLVHLYEVGYLTTDLYQLNTFGGLIEERNERILDKFFGEKPVPINRFAGIRPKEVPRSEIVEVKPGSITLIAGATLASSIIMPLVAIYVKKWYERRDQVVQFEISPQDPVLRQLLDMYDQGQFGFDDDSLRTLFRNLQNRGYDVRILTDNSYRIENVVKRYAGRMVKTINKYRP